MINLDKLSEYLKKSNANMITLSFAEIESILESELPAEAKQTAKWWWNIKDSKKAKAWLDYGFYTYDNKNIQTRGNVCFKRTEKNPEFHRGFSRIWYFLTDRDAEPHKKARALLEILVSLATILALFISIFSTIDQGKKDFERLVSQGDFAFDNKNYLDAAGYYNQAYLIAYDTYSSAYSLHHVGDCYLAYYGLVESDKDYLKDSLIIHEYIVNNPEYKNTKEYQLALIDLCSLYRLLGYDWQDEKWCSTVEQLETLYIFDNLEDIAEEDISTYISAAESLYLYYKAVLLSDKFVYAFDEDNQQKAIYYLNAEIQLEMKYNEIHGVNIYDEELLISIRNMTSYMMTNAFGNVQEYNLEILEEARIMCQNAILMIDLEEKNMSQINLYIQLKTNIAKSYFFSYFESDSHNKDDYMLKAYNELIPLFYWDDYEVRESIMHASNYMLLTRKCTEEDIQLILDRLSSYLQITQENNDVPRLIGIEMNGLNTCSIIFDFYDSEDYETSHFNAQKLGQQICTDLNTVLFDFLDSNQKEELAKYLEKFGT